MGMEIVMRSEDGRAVKLSPDRDIAHNWPTLVAAAMIGLNPEKRDAVLKDLLTTNNIDDRDLNLGIVNFCRFGERCLDPSVLTPLQALTKSDFLSTHPAVQMAILYRLGLVVSCAFFEGIRSVSNGEIPFDLHKLIKTADELYKSLVAQDKIADESRKFKSEKE